MLGHIDTCSKAVSNSIEQIAAGVYIVAIIGFVILCNRIKDWLCGVPPVSIKQRERIGTWRLRQIMKGRATHRDVLQLEPTESELDQEEAEIAAEIATRERRQAAKQDPAPSAQPKVAPQDVLFEGRKAVIRPHVHLEEMPVSTLRLTFQDGTELDIPSNLKFAGLDEKEFRVAYDAFLKTQAELGSLKGQPPPLNSKFWRERGL
jgi:hypothetical protein